MYLRSKPAHFCWLFLGYAGYIPGVKSENLYGQTYGKTTYSSSANEFHRGIDQPSDIKFNTTMKQEFIHHATQKHETVAETVGVDRGETCFKRVSTPLPRHKSVEIVVNFNLIGYSPNFLNLQMAVTA